MPWQEPSQRGEDSTVGPVQPGPPTSAAHYGDLVPQHQQFDVLYAVERPSRTSQPQSRMKIRYSKRIDTADHHARRPRSPLNAQVTATGRLLTPHRPWATQLTAATTRIQAFDPLTSAQPPLRPERTDNWPRNPACPARQPGRQPRPDTKNQQPGAVLTGNLKIAKDRG